MSSLPRQVRRAVAGVVLLVIAALPAMAQQAQPADPPASPPSRLVLEPVESGVVFVPDVRFGSVNERTATFVGGHAGWLTEQTFLAGAGGYWLANRDDDFKMAYGGAVVEWRLRGTHGSPSARGRSSEGARPPWAARWHSSGTSTDL